MDCLRTDKDYYTLDDHRISTVCDNTYIPCRHFVTDTKTSDIKEMSAFEIFLLLRSRGVVIGHFC